MLKEFDVNSQTLMWYLFSDRLPCALALAATVDSHFSPRARPGE